MKQITLDDCKNLRDKFGIYTETAEQHEIPLLCIFAIKIFQTIEEFEKNGVNQETAATMFRVILNWMNEDIVDYAKIGDRVKIYSVDDPYVDYSGKEGKITHIDDAGQLHGTWGGCALIPGVDKFKVFI